MAISYEECIHNLTSMFGEISRERIEDEFKKNNYCVEETVDVLLKIDQKQNKKNGDSKKVQTTPTSRNSAFIDQCSQESVPYYGRSTIMDPSSLIVQEMIRETNSVLDEIYEISENELNWRQLSDRLLEIRNNFQNIGNSSSGHGPKFLREEFRLRIFLHSVVPNIRTLHRKRNIGNKRFTHLLLLLGILFHQPHLAHLHQEGEHPATTLNSLESIIPVMNQEHGWWKTDFATDLRQAVELEWLPILIDNRKGLRDIGIKMLMIGLIDVFRSSFLVLPLLFLLMELSSIIRKISIEKTLSFQSLTHILKSLLLLSFGGLFLRFLSLLPGVGYSSAGVGLAALVISTSDPFMKVLCPLIAPNIAKLSELLNEINILDSYFMKTVKENRPNGGGDGVRAINDAPGSGPGARNEREGDEKRVVEVVEVVEVDNEKTLPTLTRRR